MTDYVVGFAFDGPKVVLIRKNRPAWQAGKLNGIGGHIEPGEIPIQAMVREFWEETGVQEPNWNHFCTIQGGEATIYCFYTRMARRASSLCLTTTDEEVVVRDRDDLEGTLDNIPWLLAMTEMFEFGEQTKETTSYLEIKFIRKEGVSQSGSVSHAGDSYR